MCFNYMIFIVIYRDLLLFMDSYCYLFLFIYIIVYRCCLLFICLWIAIVFL